MKPVEIASGIYEVGAIDWNIRDFHGYSTDFGTTYNAFLIVDEKVVLVDAVKKEFTDRMLSRIAEVIAPEKIDMVISNHTEMDHSGGLPRLMHRIGADKPVYCSKMGRKNLALHFGDKLNLQPLDNGAEIRIGKRTLTFLETRMLHWPDSMFTYVKEDGILFSSDAFGQHYAGYETFDDGVGDAIMAHAKKYFANILLLYAPKILKLAETITEMGLEIRMICPDHGVIWRTEPGKIVNAYVEWSKQEPSRKAVVIYDTMWKSTQLMAEAIADGIAETGVSAQPIHIRTSHRSEIMTEVLEAKAVVIGSPTLNNGLFPSVADVLTYMKGLKPKHKIGAAFGSYGWSGEAVKLLNQELSSMEIERIDDGLNIHYVPGTDDLAVCRDYGRRIGSAVIESLD